MKIIDKHNAESKNSYVRIAVVKYARYVIIMSYSKCRRLKIITNVLKIEHFIYTLQRYTAKTRLQDRYIIIKNICLPALGDPK